MKVVVTGCAGFIGFHTTRLLVERGHDVVGFDNLNPYYDPRLKEARLARLQAELGDRFAFVRGNLEDKGALSAVIAAERPERVLHLAAQAGVRYSLTHPEAYIEANLVGFLHVLEACRHHGVGHLVYASSSSVYGLNETMPFSERHPTDHPVSLYAATKKSNELMAHSYSHLFGVPTTGLRFFTVYGPWGRPDMSLFLFTQKILAGEPIPVFNHGQMRRDFTYVDDIVEGVVRVLDAVPDRSPDWRGTAPADPSTSSAPYRVFNIGHHSPVPLLEMISTLGKALGREPILDLQPMQPGDVPATFADVASLEAVTGFRPQVSIQVGIPRFVEWYRSFYGE
jgi:UDP-glucuronate 4-epimerase